MVSRQFKPRRLFLSDLDPLMIALAQETVEQNTKTSAGFCICDAARLPFHGDSIDAVFGFGFLHHVPARRDGLREVHRVLKPGGVYYMEEYYPSLYQNIVTRHLTVHPEHDRFDNDDLRKEFANVALDLHTTFELKRFWILGVGVKRGGIKD